MMRFLWLLLALPLAAQQPDFQERVQDSIESHAHLPADVMPRGG